MTFSKAYQATYPHAMFVFAVLGAFTIDDLQPGVGLLLILVGSLFTQVHK